MILRRLESDDIKELREIHKKHFSKEFPFSDLFGHSLSSLVVTDEGGKIIVGGQTRLIVEAAIVTDKDILIDERRQALLIMLDAFRVLTTKKGFNQLHAFVQDGAWERHLIKVGFTQTVGKSLVLNI